MEHSLHDALVDKGIDTALAGKLDKALSYQYMPHKGSVYTDEEKWITQIFEKGTVSVDDLNQIIEWFPGLIVEPALLRKRVINKGAISINTFIQNLRLDV